MLQGRGCPEPNPATVFADLRAPQINRWLRRVLAAAEQRVEPGQGQAARDPPAALNGSPATTTAASGGAGGGGGAGFGAVQGAGGAQVQMLEHGSLALAGKGTR